MRVREARNDDLVGGRAAIAARAWRKPVMLEIWPLRPAAFMEEMLAIQSEYSVASLEVSTAEGAPCVLLMKAWRGSLLVWSAVSNWWHPAHPSPLLL